MKNQLENHGIRNVVGYRSPFLQHAGDHTLAVLKDHGFLYDSSIQTKEEQLWWPYTFEYKIPMKDCVVKPCPKSEFPKYMKSILFTNKLEIWKDFKKNRSFSGTHPFHYLFSAKNFFDFSVKKIWKSIAISV